MTECKGYAAEDASGALTPWSFTRRAVGANDVKIKVAYCGVCHSDLHQVRNEWANSMFPMVPGHEIVGIVTEVGGDVTHVKPGDRGAVGCLVSSCRECDSCHHDLEQFCPGMVFTYNAKMPSGEPTFGGYSSDVVVDAHFCLKFPETLSMAAGAPLLCAGITVYSPMRYYGLDKPGMKIGVVGLGGLGHMVVKFAKAFGMHCTVFSTTPGKRDEAVIRLGADAFIVSKNPEEMATAAGTLDGIIDTVSAQHELTDYLPVLKASGKYVCVGAPPEPYSVPAFALLFRRITVGGSLVGGIKETQEMLDFCAEKNVVCDIEKIPMDYINKAFERLEKSDVRYRFVLDVEGSLK